MTVELEKRDNVHILFELFSIRYNIYSQELFVVFVKKRRKKKH